MEHHKLRQQQRNSRKTGKLHSQVNEHASHLTVALPRSFPVVSCSNVLLWFICFFRWHERLMMLLILIFCAINWAGAWHTWQMLRWLLVGKNFPWNESGSWSSSFEGRAIAQAVSRRLHTAAARVQTRVWSYGILWWLTKVALGQVFSENFGFPCQSTFHLLLHNHLHYHSRLANRPGVAAVPIASQTK
jgi:hypothetical protein